MASSSPLLRTLAGEAQRPPPVWLMRQAGRYLPEYRRLRAEHGAQGAGDAFVAFCASGEAATEAALQPLRRFPSLSAAILFHDILLLPAALGVRVSYPEGGPRLAALSSPSAIHAFCDAVEDSVEARTREGMAYAASNIARLKAHPELGNRAVIGFAGAPWTLACYLLEGQGRAGFPRARACLVQEPAALARLLEVLERAVGAFLALQREAGADLLQLFDSWGGLLEGEAFVEHAARPALRLAGSLGQDGPLAYPPLLLHIRGEGAHWPALLGLASGLKLPRLAISPDADVDAAALLASDEAEAFAPSDLVFQGNLDPGLLAAECALAELEVGWARLHAAMAGRPWVVNLGAGLGPGSEPLRVEKLLALASEAS